MSTLSFNAMGGFTENTSKTMARNTTNNNKVDVCSKVGYVFQGWYCDYQSGGRYDAKHVNVYESSGSSWIANQKIVTVFEDGSSWIAEDIPASDDPIVEVTVKVFDANGKAVKSDYFWSDDYPNGVYLNGKDVTVYPVFSEVPFVNRYFKQIDECHLYKMVDGVMTRVEVFNDGS